MSKVLNFALEGGFKSKTMTVYLKGHLNAATAKIEHTSAYEVTGL